MIPDLTSDPAVLAVIAGVVCLLWGIGAVRRWRRG